jgi:hypothetical protein
MRDPKRRVDWPWRRAQAKRQLRLFVPLAVLALATSYSCAFFQYTSTYANQPAGWPALTSRSARPILIGIAKASARSVLFPLRTSKAPLIQLEIKPRHFARIIEKREEAMERQFLISSSDDFVPARIRHGGKTVRARVRLKGDLTDHLLGDKWSYRVEIRDGESVLGMRRFSLQAPYTRDYLQEPIFLDFVREHGVLAPRYDFVEVRVNNRRVGVMAMEEHFSTELLEDQARRDGLILRFDEQYFYQAELSFMDLVADYDNWRNVPVDAFRSGRISKSPLLQQQWRIAGGLLRGVADDVLAPSDAFDAELWGRFLAACEIFSRPHLTHWNNLRFYLNPITLKLEPIAYDSTGETQPYPGLRCMGFAHAMTTDLIADPVLRRAFLRNLEAMRQEVMSDEFERWLYVRQAHYLRRLTGEYPWISGQSTQPLRKRSEQLRLVTASSFREHILPAPPRKMPHSDDADYPQIVQATLQQHATEPYLELANAISRPVTVTALSLEIPDRADPTGEPSRKDASLYERLPPTRWPDRPERIRLALPWPLPEGDGWRIVGRALVGARSHDFIAVPGSPPLLAPALPQANLELALAEHSFLHLSTDEQWLEAETGEHDVLASVILPSGMGLRLQAGTTLRFAPDAMLLIRGPVAFEGSEAAPVVLDALEDLWSGMAVLGDSTPVDFAHVVVRRTQAPTQPGWGLTGGVTLHRSIVRLTNSLFESSAAEDSLNIIRSEFLLRNVVIQHAASDALDADFCQGRIEGGAIVDAMGDGIDVSGSELVVEGTRLADIRDKAFSIGEASRAEIRAVSVRNSGVAVASKDGSRALIEDSELDGLGVAALMVYVKKPEYGAAALEAKDVRVSNSVRIALVQHGSELSLNGETVASEALDVDALYEAGPMQK